MTRRSPAPLADLAAAWMLLTRIPAPLRPEGAAMREAAMRGAAASWAYPLIGALLGAVAAGALAALLALGIAPGPAAGIALALSVLLTGAMHEDGLADAADGLGGGASRERALEIMKDSRIGVFGAAALGLSLLIRWSALAALAGASPLLAASALIGAACLSRAPLALGLAFLPSARATGLSAAQGRAPLSCALLALLIALLAALALAAIGFGRAAPLGAAIALGAAFLFLRRAARFLGGQTGDVLGAAQQIAESLLLAALTAAGG